MWYLAEPWHFSSALFLAFGVSYNFIVTVCISDFGGHSFRALNFMAAPAFDVAQVVQVAAHASQAAAQAATALQRFTDRSSVKLEKWLDNQILMALMT